jgi:hypothetical protein
MKKLFLISSIFLVVSCGTFATKSDLSDRVDSTITTTDCSTVAPEKILECSANLLRLSNNIIKDPGKLISQKILEKDNYCSRVEQVWEYGSDLKSEFRQRRTNSFRVCNYEDFWDKLAGEWLFGGTGFVLGFITGAAVVHGGK